MRPSLSRFRSRRHYHSSGRYLMDKGRLRSEWWGNHLMRPNDRIQYKVNMIPKSGVVVPLCFFSYRSKYASNYDLWRAYQYALQLLPIVFANALPDSNLASIATNCIFNSFCTAYPQETRIAKESIAQYLHRCRPIRARPLRGRIIMDGMDGMDVD